MTVYDELFMKNRSDDSNSDAGSGNIAVYVKNGVLKTRVGGGAGLVNAPVQVAQFTASAFSLAIGATIVDFTSVFNSIPSLSFASHAFSLPEGIYGVDVIVNIDNALQSTAGTYRKLELKKTSTVVAYDIREPLLANMPARCGATVVMTGATAMSVVFTHDAGHAIAGTLTITFTKVG